MTQAIHKKPDIVQAFDFYEDREYYKISRGFLFSSQQKVRTDRLEDWKQWSIECEKLPDKIYVNGREYQLLELKK